MTNIPMIRQSSRILLLLGSIMVMFAGVIAQQVTVSGSAPGAEGKTIKLVTWADLITFTEEPPADGLAWYYYLIFGIIVLAFIGLILQELGVKIGRRATSTKTRIETTVV